ncbi:MAG: hypothetical protein FJ206_15855 [Gemmatimonadetes bacterium]|nr:hypothetical protein [Gemmatimonadota bacterium]
MTTPTPRSITIPLALWVAAALAVGGAGWLRPLQPPAPQVLLLGLTAALLIVGRLIPGYRSWLQAVDVRVLVALHVTRVVGAYFLILYRRGELPYAFAVPGGWGDILVAVGAMALLLVGAPTTPARLWWYRAWNVLGLLDILFVVATAARLALADASSMQALLQLPLSVLPTFLVPLIIASHLWLFGRLRAAPAPADG